MEVHEEGGVLVSLSGCIRWVLGGVGGSFVVILNLR
jgi:hypothetical protein